MIQKVSGTLRFIEAQAIRKAQKADRLIFYIIRLFGFCLLFHLVFFFSMFFTKTHIFQVFLLLGFVSLIPFSFLLYRIITFTAPGKKLSRMAAFYEKDKNSFVNAMRSSIFTNLAVCSVIFVLVLVYFLFMYGICSIFISTSLQHFYLSFITCTIICGTSLYSVFLYAFAKGKDLLWPKILLPAISGVFAFLLLLFANVFLAISPGFVYVCSFSTAWFFSYPLIRKLSGDNNLIIPYRFVTFCYIIILILFFISFLKIDLFLHIPFQDSPYIQPIVGALTLFFDLLKSKIFTNILFIISLPHMFVPVVLVAGFIYNLGSRFRQKLSLRMVKNQSHYNNQQIEINRAGKHPANTITIIEDNKEVMDEPDQEPECNGVRNHHSDQQSNIKNIEKDLNHIADSEEGVHNLPLFLSPVLVSFPFFYYPWNTICRNHAIIRFYIFINKYLPDPGSIQTYISNAGKCFLFFLTCMVYIFSRPWGERV